MRKVQIPGKHELVFGSRFRDAKIPRELKTVDVTLQPDLKFAEEKMDVDRIWGKPIVFKNVPLERYDLEED